MFMTWCAQHSMGNVLLAWKLGIWMGIGQTTPLLICAGELTKRMLMT